MKLTVSWWDKNEGIGIATSETGVECLLHRSNLSPLQCKSLYPRMTIHGEAKEISNGVFIIEKIRIINKSNENKNSIIKKHIKEITL